MSDGALLEDWRPDLSNADNPGNRIGQTLSKLYGLDRLRPSRSSCGKSLFESPNSTVSLTTLDQQRHQLIATATVQAGRGGKIVQVLPIKVPLALLTWEGNPLWLIGKSATLRTPYKTSAGRGAHAARALVQPP
jgi:hypothetical protein